MRTHDHQETEGYQKQGAIEDNIAPRTLIFGRHGPRIVVISSIHGDPL